MDVSAIGKRFCVWLIANALLCIALHAENELLYVDLNINDQVSPGIFTIALYDERLWILAEQVPQLQLRQASRFKQREIFNDTFMLMPKSITYTINRELLVLNLAVPKSELPNTVLVDEKSELNVSPKTYAFYWNYHLALFHDPIITTATFETAHKPVLATPIGSLVNQFTTNLGPVNSIVRLETSFEFDVEKRNLRFTFIDSATDAPSWGNHVAMAGIKVQKNFLFQTGSLSYPTISLQGFAPRTGHAEIWMNDALRESKELPRGGFLLDNLNLPTGSHSGVLVVRDPNGIVSNTPFSYYADSQLLRPRMQSFSYSLGFTREKYGIESFNYGEPLLFGSHKFGVTNFWSPGFHTEANFNLFMLGTEQRFGLWRFGSTALGCAFSAQKNDRVGYLLSKELNLNFFRVLTSTHAQWSTKYFSPVGVREESTKDPIYLLSGSLRLDMPYINQTALSYIFIHRGKPRVNAIGLKQSLPFFDSLAMSLNGEFDFLTNNVGIFFFIGAPLPYLHHVSAQANKNGDHYGGATSLSKSPDTSKNFRYGYNASTGYDKFVYGQGDVNLDTNFINNRISAYGTREKFHYMAEVNGSFGGIKDQLFFSRPVDGNILLIELPEQKNVGVWRDNNIFLGKTNRRGRLVVTNLRPFETAHLGFDAKDMALTTKSSSSSQEIDITPGSQSAHRVALSAPIIRNVEFRLRREQENLSPGTRITMQGMEQAFVMSDGTVFVEVPKNHASIDGVDERGECKFSLTLPRENDSLIEKLGDVYCK